MRCLRLCRVARCIIVSYMYLHTVCLSTQVSSVQDDWIELFGQRILEILDAFQKASRFSAEFFLFHLADLGFG